MLALYVPNFLSPHKLLTSDLPNLTKGTMNVPWGVSSTSVHFSDHF